MRRACATDGNEVISCRGIPVPSADIFFFSRMAAKVRQQPVTDKDVLAVEQQVNIDSILSSLQICHFIVVNQYDICALVKSLELQVPPPQVRRRAPYVALLHETSLTVAPVLQ